MDGTGPGEIVTFYSYKGGTGRTMALANVAWILASNGRSVLAVDWDLESPGLHHYFHPFLIDKELKATSGILDIFWDFSFATLDPRGDKSPDWHEPYADVLRHAVSLRWDFPSRGNIDLLGAGRQNKSFGARVNGFDWHAFYNRLGGGAFIESMKARMRQSYDYVLIDSRTGLSDTSGICTVQMPDTLVACFTMNNQSISGCASVTESVVRQRQEGASLRILPVPMRVESGETDRLEESRDYARWCFERPLRHNPSTEPDSYWGDVEVPYKSFYAYEEMLAPIGDRPHQEDTVLAACERLTEHLTQGAVTGCVAMEEPTRRRLRQEYRSRPDRQSEYDFYLSYASEDRDWAEWISAELTAAGVRVFLETNTATGTNWALVWRSILQRNARLLVLVSPHYLEADRSLKYEMSFAGIVEAEEALKRIIPVKLCEFDTSALLSDKVAIDLAGLEEDEARTRLIDALEAVMGSRADSSSPAAQTTRRLVRYPHARPTVWRMPKRAQDFVGRDRELLLLWRRFRDLHVTVALSGMAGVGKTALALEYAYRYRGNYDIAWYTGPTDMVEVNRQVEGVTSLLPVENEPGTSSAGDRHPAGSPRLLIIVDGVDETDTPPVKPPFPCHVITISRSHSVPPNVHSLSVQVLPAQDAIALLQRLLPDVTPRDAARIASRFGNLPLALHVAAGHLSRQGASVSDYLALLDHQMDQVLLRSTGDSGQSLMLRVTQELKRLQQRDPAARHLLSLLSLVSPNPVPIKLVRAAPETFARPLRTVADDDGKLDATLDALTREGLAESSNGLLRTHPVLAAVVRSDMSVEEQQAFSGELVRMLVANDPGDPSRPECWPKYRTLMPLATSVKWPTDVGFRELLLRLCWFQLSTGNPLTAKDLTERVAKRFDALLGDLHEDSLAARHISALCDWELGDEKRAADGLQWLVMARQQLLGEDHPVTLASLNNLAAVLAAQKRWQDAIRLHESIVTTRRQSLGSQHPDTLLSEGNLASCYYGSGRHEEALHLEKAVYQLRKQILGVQHPATLASMENLAAVNLELGRSQDALPLLEAAWAQRRTSMGDTHPDTLRCAAALISARESAGRHDGAREMARAILGDLEKVLGAGHPLAQKIANMSKESDR
ncbi:hypothetical protein GCM10010145_06910 [Streptomyces ruber]|uniref:TIR domain-containing protein n=2 Tax=Streptomyces TaxID=1883 RepID=A0A918B7M0_9ACTN|nr:FxSxx-COOH system tetratricopeptide repeat protein [Streptomyces ruber]GGQ41266.1 hypothetical protein GCM10010145_06910 [Streptomyces ruber]